MGDWIRSGVFGLALLVACGPRETRSETQDAADSVTDGAMAEHCKSHQDCVDEHARHWICRADHKCVGLLSSECKVVRGDDADDDAVFVGVLGAEPNVAKLMEVVDLARGDFVRAVGGLPRAGKKEARPFVLVGCAFPYGGDPLPAARHLVERVGVRAMIGPWSSPDALNVAQNLSIPAGVLLITPSSQSDVLSELADGDLVFRTNPTARAIAPQIAAMLSDVEGLVRKKVLKAELKVALVYQRDTYGLAVSEATTERLRFNDGLSSGENERRGCFLSVSYDGSEKTFERDLAKRVVAFAPDIVIVLTAVDVRPFRAIEGAWPSDIAAPYYVTDAGVLSAEHLAFVASRPDSLRARLRISTSLDPARPLYRGFVERVAREIGSSASLLDASNTYDAAYALAYGIIAATESPLTGAGVAQGLRRLVGSGDKVEVVPEQIRGGVATLLSGMPIDLDGVSGALDFDEHGDVLTNGSVWCLERDPETKRMLPTFSGQVYQRMTGKLEGTFQCD